jgi:hypothetical protein
MKYLNFVIIKTKVNNIKNKKLTNICKNSHHKKIIQKLFNPNNSCWDCLLVSNMTLEDACRFSNIDIDKIISQIS